MKSKVNELVEGVSKLEDGTISLTELEITVDIARDLYEKLIVIRHKVYEQSILEIPSYDFSLVEVDLSEPVSNTMFEENITIQSQTTHFPQGEEVNPIPNDELINNELNGELFFETEPTEIEVSSIESEAIDSSNASWEMNATEYDDELIEENQIDNTDSFEVENMSTSEQSNEDSLSAEMAINNEESPSEITSVWVGKLLSMESQMTDSFALSKLDTLIGSFGLNERLQFINELFEGSSEAFSEAVKMLDTRTGMDSAREKMAEFAQGNNWDNADPETVSDFVSKIKRRYA
jgi:hypothetical protein